MGGDARVTQCTQRRVDSAITNRVHLYTVTMARRFGNV